MELKVVRWQFMYDELPGVEPKRENVEESYDYKEDLLQIHNIEKNLLIDVGWYPEGDFSAGQLVARVYEGDCHSKLIEEFVTKSREELVNKINEWIGSLYPITAEDALKSAPELHVIGDTKSP